MVLLHELNQATSVGAPVGLILPGAGYTAQAPLLYWSAEALIQSGWHVYAAEWSLDRESRATPEEFVAKALDQVIGELPDMPGLVVAKSLGTFALPFAVGAGIPGVWLTPILTISQALKRAPTTHLAIGGSVDPAWAPEHADGTEASLVTVDGADHSLHIAGKPWTHSLHRQEAIISLVAQHASALI